MRLAKITLSILCCLLLISGISAIEKGSDYLISIQPFFSFPASDPDNSMLTFGYFKSGFGLQDVTTTCTFKSIFPVSGDINLRGGQLFLNSDLHLENVATLVSSGIVLGNDHVFDLAQSVTGIPASYNSVFQDTKIFLHSDLLISGTVKFKGNCLVDGAWNCLSLAPNANLVVDRDATVHFRNIEIDGIAGTKIHCLNEAGTIILDNMRWVQEADYTFTAGSMRFINQVNFAGPYVFYYQSTQTSTIDPDSCWYLSDLTKVSMGRKNSPYDREPLYFTDRSAMLRMDNSTLDVTSNGMRLTRGTFLSDGEVKFDINSTDSTHGLLLGDGTAVGDIEFKLYPGSILYLAKGHLVHDIINVNNFLAGNVEKRFIRQNAGTYFYTFHDTYFTNIEIKAPPAGQTIVSPGKKLVFSSALITLPTSEFVITATRQDSMTYLLYGDGAVECRKGVFPLNLKVYKTGNLLRGPSDVSGLITLQNSESVLSLDVSGQMLKNIGLNGGTLLLNKDLRLGKDVTLTGSGKIDLSKYNLFIATKDLSWSGTTVLSGDGAVINVNANLSVSSELTFMGNCTLDGKGNELHLLPSGNIVVAKNSTLRLKNLFLTGVTGTKLRCFDNSAAIVLDNVSTMHESNYSFTVGSLKFLNDVSSYGMASEFLYQTALTSTLATNATWCLCDGLKLVMGRKSGFYGREPLWFEDSSATLNVDNASVSITTSGMRFTRGTLVVNRDVLFEINGTSSTAGFIVGNRTAVDDPICKLSPTGTIRIPKGSFVFEGTTPAVFVSKSKLGRLVIDPSFSFYVNENVSMENLTVEFTPGWKLFQEAGKTVSYSDCAFGLPGIRYEVTGKRYNAITNLLDGNGKVIVTTGALPLYTRVCGSGNIISGLGGIAGPVTLQDSKSVLTLDTFGGLFANVTMNGGKIIAGKPILLSDDVVFTGSGTVNLSNRYIHIGGQNLNWTGTTYWDSNSGIMFLRNNLPLSSKWTFSGKCTIFGGGNILHLSPSAKIVIERGSSLTIKDLTLNRVLAEQIYCADNAGKITLNNVKLILDSNYSFSAGTMKVQGDCKFIGDACTFTLQSSMPSTIDTRSTLLLDKGLTFSYDPLNGKQNNIVFTDKTSSLLFSQANLHVTKSGLQLKKGNLVVIGGANFYAEYKTLLDGTISPTVGIVIGNNTELDDCLCEIRTGAKLSVDNGYLIYRNINASALKMENPFSTIRMNATSRLMLDQTISLGVGLLELSSSALLERADEVSVVGSVSIL